MRFEWPRPIVSGASTSRDAPGMRIHDFSVPSGPSRSPCVSDIANRS